MCLHYCASCCQNRSLSLSFFDSPARPPLWWQTQNTLFTSHNVRLLRGKLSAQVVTGETILLNLQCNNVLRQTERKCGWWYNLTFTRALKSCSWKEQASHIETLKWSWPLLSENISNKKFYNRGVIFFRFCFCFFVFEFEREFEILLFDPALRLPLWAQENQYTMMLKRRVIILY